MSLPTDKASVMSYFKAKLAELALARLTQK